MAPDRRFGLPHPLDADPSEDSSPRKPGLWESLKRALGSPAAELSGADETRGRPPAPPLPAAPPPASSLRSPGPVEHDAPAPESRPAGSGEISRNVPFLDDLPFEPVTPAAAGSHAVPELPVEEPGEASAPGAVPPPELSDEAVPSTDPFVPPARGPRLARGLASFSRDNARREKKFAHLLRDEPEAPGKHPEPPRRRR